MSTSVDALPPAPIAVEERVLEDLRSRLRATTWPEDDGNEDGRYGVPRALLQELARYWAEEYDWRAAERAMNAYEHYLVDVSGTRVHFMRKPGAGPDPTPLILSHGWPWTFWHWSKVIDRLADPAAFGGDPADAFEVIVPSLPGIDPRTINAPTSSRGSLAARLYLTRIQVMTMMIPLADAKARLSAVLDDVRDTHDRVVITRNGRPEAVIISVADLETIEETLDLLSTPGALEEIRTAEAEIARGEAIGADELRRLMAERIRGERDAG